MIMRLAFGTFWIRFLAWEREKGRARARENAIRVKEGCDVEPDRGGAEKPRERERERERERD